MSSQVIHFGTSGWRGVIAEDFTFPGVRRASAAIAGHVLTRKKPPVLLVGYDARFFSPEFARTSAAVLRARVPERLRGEVKEFVGRRVARTDRIDGLQLTFDDGEWVLMRPSGTEPLVRIYTESSSTARSESPAEEARAWITQ